MARGAGGRWEAEETYSCFDYCKDAEGYTSDPEVRRRFRCALPDYDQSRWLPPHDPLNPSGTAMPARRYMGLLKVLPTDPPNRPESHDDGCPGAWYRSAFVFSLHKYERLLTKSGFSENMLLSRSDDRLVLEAIQLYEAEKMAARNHYEELINRD